MKTKDHLLMEDAYNQVANSQSSQTENNSKDFDLKQPAREFLDRYRGIDSKIAGIVDYFYGVMEKRNVTYHEMPEIVIGLMLKDYDLVKNIKYIADTLKDYLTKDR